MELDTGLTRQRLHVDAPSVTGQHTCGPRGRDTAVVEVPRGEQRHPVPSGSQLRRVLHDVQMRVSGPHQEQITQRGVVRCEWNSSHDIDSLLTVQFGLDAGRLTPLARLRAQPAAGSSPSLLTAVLNAAMFGARRRHVTATTPDHGEHMREAGKESSDIAGSPSVTPGCNDAATAARAARTSAFAEYLEPEIDVLLRVARTLTGTWADAEDLVQDTLIRAYRALDSFDGAHPRAWLLTILRNTNINSHRRQRPDLLDDDDSLERHTPAFGATETSTPEQAVTERELGEDLHQAVAALDPKFSAVLLLVDVDELSYAEVAEVLGIAVGTVTSRLSRARKRIRHDLNAAAKSKPDSKSKRSS